LCLARWLLIFQQQLCTPQLAVKAHLPIAINSNSNGRSWVNSCCHRLLQHKGSSSSSSQPAMLALQVLLLATITSAQQLVPAAQAGCKGHTHLELVQSHRGQLLLLAGPVKKPIMQATLCQLGLINSMELLVLVLWRTAQQLHQLKKAPRVTFLPDQLAAANGPRARGFLSRCHPQSKQV
jgi:hypothetical protein